MKRDSKAYVEDMIQASEKILAYTDGVSFEDFTKDLKAVDAVLLNFVILGEAANKVPEEVQSKYSEIPWRTLVGMRNIIVHEYFEVAHDILWKTAKENVLPLKEKLEVLRTE